MLWTLAAFLLTMSLVLVQFLKTIIDRVKDTYFVYPSDAVIDQVLPQEIMEHVMTFLDPRAMMECRVVSKYWRHHAIKPTIESEVTACARHRLREVCQELKANGLTISNDQIDSIMDGEYTQGQDFVRAAAIASKHGADLLVGLLSITKLCPNWPNIKKDKKYFLLEVVSKHERPWRFTTSNLEFGAKLMFDNESADWYNSKRWSMASILIDGSLLNPLNVGQEYDRFDFSRSYCGDDIKLYSYRALKPTQYFYFIPLNYQILHALLFLLAPLIVHDALYSNYLPTIKSWFGQVMFIVSFGLQLFIARIFAGFSGQRPSKNFFIAWSIYLSSYLFLTWLAYPASMTAFAGVGILGLMFVYTMLSRQYFVPYDDRHMSKRKWQLFGTVILLIFMTIDWKLVVDSTRDLSIFRTLFDNTFYYCLILLHFIMDNFLGWVAREGLDISYIVKWDRDTVRILRNCYSFVLLMTLVAPTWRGNPFYFQNYRVSNWQLVNIRSKMLWTLAAFLLTMSLVLIQFLKTIIDRVKDTYFVYPSDAVIDQALPQEIMEHVMTFLDPRAMMECRVVSKYWHHHAIKPTVENSVAAVARHRLREVYRELQAQGINISNDEIETAMHSNLVRKENATFVRAAAIAGKHGSDLIVGFVSRIIYHRNWPNIKAKKSYLMLEEGVRQEQPWQFLVSHESSIDIYAEPVFDETSVDWHDPQRWSSANILFDLGPFTKHGATGVKLYLYRPINPTKYFYFIPLNSHLLPVLLFMLSPLIVHDALYSNYLPTIKSWFGQVMFIITFGIQLLIAKSDGYSGNTPSKRFFVSWGIYLSSYLFLTWLAYPASMTVFAGVGIIGLMFIYMVLSKDYFNSHSSTIPMSRKKWQLFGTVMLLIFMMIDWKLVVDSTRDLSIFRTLFDNTFYYCIILVHFIMDNFLCMIEREGFDIRYLWKWDRETMRILRNYYSFVLLMTLVAPTWRGNHL